MSEKNSFIMYSDVIEYTQDMTDEQLGQLYRAQLQYANGIEPTITDPEVKGIWRVIKHQMDVNSDKYESKRKQMQANANKRKQMQAEATKSNQIESVTVTDNVTVSKETPKGVKKAASRFLPPSVDEVAAYCQERRNRVNPQQFVDFYASKGWRVGNQPMKDWKAAMRTWEQRDKDLPRDNHGTEREQDLDAVLLNQVIGRRSNDNMGTMPTPGRAGYYTGELTAQYAGP